MIKDNDEKIKEMSEEMLDVHRRNNLLEQTINQ